MGIDLVWCTLLCQAGQTFGDRQKCMIKCGAESYGICNSCRFQLVCHPSCPVDVWNSSPAVLFCDKQWHIGCYETTLECVLLWCEHRCELMFNHAYAILTGNILCSTLDTIAQNAPGNLIMNFSWVKTAPVVVSSCLQSSLTDLGVIGSCLMPHPLPEAVESGVRECIFVKEGTERKRKKKFFLLHFSTCLNNMSRNPETVHINPFKTDVLHHTDGHNTFTISMFMLLVFRVRSVVH